MPIWSAEIKEIQILLNSFKGQFPDLEKELKPLITSEDSNVVLLYSRRCLEVIVTELCEIELKRPRKTEPLKGIIDKLNSEEKVPFNIVTSMHSLNSLSTFGTHPKDFDQEQVKPVLNNLAIIVRWYLKYRETQSKGKVPPDTQKESDRTSILVKGKTQSKIKKILIYSITILIVVAAVLVIVKFNVFDKKLEKSIAVLPFRNDSHDDSTQYFMDGVMEELLMNLQKIKELRVLGRTSVEQYRSQNKTIPQIAKELGVNYIIEGSGQKSGNSLRIRVQLIRANKESHIWANNFEQENLNLKDYFKIQSNFAESIARELDAVITPGEKQLIETVPTERLEAYDAYLKGQFYYHKITSNDMDIAMQYFELAKELDPDFALAYVGIGTVWLGRQVIGAAVPEEAGPKVLTSFMKALELDSTIAEVHYTLAIMNTYGMWDWKSAESEFKKANAINPNYADARALYSHLLNFLGRPKEAMEQMELALKLDPHNPTNLVTYSHDLLFVQRYDEVISVSRELFDKNPTMFVALDPLFQALHLTGRYEEAFEVMKNCYTNMYKDFDHVFDQYDKLGYAGTLSLEGDTLLSQSRTKYIVPLDIAYFYIFAGNKEKALECLEQAYELHDPNMPYITRPTYAILRDEPRFQDLLRKLNLTFNY
jgi:TolB-like protein/predicted nucleic acid-binding Zn ribbon protein